ncbi:TrlF family AAA-like ATPase [Streptococcus suis]|uniref:TrlF family AAA-like ATPase n=1 Tax=Streptococcus suis TaxID=1307 RepID=UPI00396A0C6D
MLQKEKEEYITSKKRNDNTYQYDEVEHKWEKYINKINDYVNASIDERNIKVIGITDYYSIRNYEYLLSNKEKLDSNIEMLVPNVELRLTMRGGDIPINIHCIFNPKIVNELHEKFFTQIKMSIGEENYSATEASFIKLGKKISDTKTLDDEQYEKIGIENFTVEFSILKDVFKDTELRENTIIVVANKSTDGASGLDGQLRILRKDIYRFADAIFSGTPSDIKFFSGEKSYEGTIKDCGKLMPCFHGSDAHSYDKMFEPTEKRYCYIKSEISFDGLKQVLNDPKDRVYIGKKCPILEKIEETKNNKIKTLTINNKKDDSWFQDVSMEFNPQLNVIIGNKGNGKTAIGDILSLCGNIKPTKDFKFLSQFSKTEDAKNIDSQITFLDGTSTDSILLSQSPYQQTPRVKYIPQAYFETITNEVDKTEKLKEEVEGVIFEYLPPTVRGAYSSFSEYRENIEYEAQGRISQLRESLSEINTKIVRLEDYSAEPYIETLRNDLRNREKELSEHIAVRPKENHKSTTDSIDMKSELEMLNRWKKKLSAKERFKEKLEKCVSNYIKKKNKVDRINNELEQKVQDVKDYFEEYYEFLFEHDLEDILKIEYKTDKIESYSNKLQKEIDIINEYLSKPYLENEKYSKNSLEGRIYIIKNKINTLEAKASNRTTTLLIEQEKKENWEKRRLEIEGEKNGPKEGTIRYYKEKLSYIEKDLPKELKQLCEKRLDAVQSIIKCKLDVLSQLEKGTEELKKFISANNGSILTIESELSFNNNFVDKFLANINQQKTSSYQGRVQGRETLHNVVEDHFSNGVTSDQIIHFLSKVDTLNKEYERKGEKVSSDLSFIKDRVELYNYLFSLNYISVEFSLKMGEKSLERLSPGERGAILLVFYLLLDKGEIPLIIDQPEDNLDNQSIADVLVPYIREAKKKRQIIMITHNPNLAVISDAELVIHVGIDKENHNLFSYTSGGIEDRTINKKIQDILEGTPRAFRIRDNKPVVLVHFKIQ